MGILQTAERSTHLDSSENVVFQRHLVAYKEAAKIISGTVLEIGSGEGYGVMELASFADKFFAVDKYETIIPKAFKKKNNVTFIQTEVPPLTSIESSSVDFVVTFQVIEHIKDDKLFLSEIKRVLKPGGYLILSIPKDTAFIFDKSEFCEDTKYKIIKDDYYDGMRNGEIMRVFKSRSELKEEFLNLYEDFNFGEISDDCFGLNFHWHLMIAKKK